MCSVSLGIPVAGLEDAAGLGCGVVAQQDTATVSPRCAFLFRRAGSSAAPDGRRVGGSASVGSAVLLLWLSHLGCSQH